MTLSPTVLPHHVDEAIRLFKYSTMDAVSAGSVEGLTRGELNDEVEKIEREVRRRLPIGWSTSYQSLVREFVTQQGYSSHALERTLYIMEKREILRFSGQVRGCGSVVTSRRRSIADGALFLSSETHHPPDGSLIFLAVLCFFFFLDECFFFFVFYLLSGLVFRCFASVSFSSVESHVPSAIVHESRKARDPGWITHAVRGSYS